MVSERGVVGRRGAMAADVECLSDLNPEVVDQRCRGCAGWVGSPEVTSKVVR